METGRNVMHYALGDNQDYEHEWSKAVLEYLENGYSSEDGKRRNEYFLHQKSGSSREILLHYGMERQQNHSVQRL